MRGHPRLEARLGAQSPRCASNRPQSRQLSAGDSPEIGTTDVHIDTMSMKAFYKRALTLLFRATWEAAAEVPVSAVYSCSHVAGCLDGRGSLW